jgi:hypothetical protein
MLKKKVKNKKKKLEKKKVDDENEYEDMDSEELVASGKTPTKQVYLPGDPLNEDEELVREESAYEMFHEAQTGKYVVCKARKRSLIFVL